MSVFAPKVLTKKPSDISLLGGPVLDGTPFRLYPSAPNPDKSVDVRISEFSSVLDTFNIKEYVKLVGLNLGLNIKYADKIWLEIFYDQNLVPVIGLVRTSKKWAGTTVNPSNTQEKVAVYPKELEFITKLDVTNKVTELDDALDWVENLRTLALAELLFKKNSGQYEDDEEYAQNVTALNDAYDKVRTALQDYKNSLAQFFSSAPNANWQKLFRTYTPIAYTTKNLNINLEGVNVSPKIQPLPQAPTVSTATKSEDFKIVQMLNNDLILADACYLNRFPARVPTPYHRPVYPFYIENELEETTNTK